jgi:bacterioferritin-associated ferredoxin
MYVCICHAVTESEIHSAVRAGAQGMEDLQNRLNVATCCGTCVDSVAECLEQANTPPRTERSVACKRDF